MYVRTQPSQKNWRQSSLVHVKSITNLVEIVEVTLNVERMLVID